jgi:hypothetical protein
LSVEPGRKAWGVASYGQTAPGQAQFGGGGSGELSGAMVGQEVADEGSGETMDQLLFFMAAQRSSRMDFAL